jgi:hypothetical protein
MDVRRNQEHDHTHLGICSPRPQKESGEPSSGGSGTGGVFRPPEGLGTSLAAAQMHFTQPITKLLKHTHNTQTLLPPAQRFPELKKLTRGAPAALLKYQHPELDIVRSALNDTQPVVPTESA